jgi:hypothetical protein
MTAVKRSATGRVVALALTWDGSRWPARSLPPAARAFLGRTLGRAPRAASMSELLAAGKIRELRICWAPRLQGGDEVLAAPFSPPGGRRVRFRTVEQRRFGDVLGVVYRVI